MTARWSASAVFLAGLLVPACFNPHIQPGAFKCSDGGNLCPSNFQCASDGLCYPPDGAPAPTLVCTGETPNNPTCMRSQQPCSPACQFGCSCGWCGLDNTTGAVKCLMGTPGTKVVGEVCDPATPSDCAPGLTCRTECSSGAARCHKFCDTSADCDANTMCMITIGGGALHLCTLPDPQCDPIAKTGCPTGFGCYPLSGTSTECDCAGSGGSGVACGFLTDCMPGYQCVSLTGVPNNGTCQKLCRTSADCGGASICVTSGTTYGYCTP